MIAILIHLFYEESWERFIKQKLLHITGKETTLLINICIAIRNKTKLIDKIKNEFPDCYIIESPNIGKDIGGKLALIDLLLHININTEFIIFLHDKQSPQSATGESWREALMKITDPKFVETIPAMFQKDKMLGIVAAKEFIINENDIRNSNKNNEHLVDELSENFLLKKDKHNFIGGTMFWVRSKIFTDFFKNFSPLNCRSELEHGNVLDINAGTYTHAWERIFCRIVVSNGFTIKGV